mgnify:CR=1 FL=1
MQHGDDVAALQKRLHDLGFDAYATGEIRKDDVIHIMVGDLQRLIVYGRKGWSAPQDVPAEVIDGWRALKRAADPAWILGRGVMFDG